MKRLILISVLISLFLINYGQSRQTINISGSSGGTSSTDTNTVRTIVGRSIADSNDVIRGTLITTAQTATMIGDTMTARLSGATTALTPTITVSAGASVLPPSGVSINFSVPQNYIVTAEDLSETLYVVTVIVDAEESETPTNGFMKDSTGKFMIDSTGHYLKY